MEEPVASISNDLSDCPSNSDVNTVTDPKLDFMKYFKPNTILSGEELYNHSKRAEKSIPSKGGHKDFEPDESCLQAKKMNMFYSRMETLLTEPRTEKLGSLLVGIWDPEKNLVEYKKDARKFWAKMGFVDEKRKWLYPEEALYLMEINCLEVYNNEVPLSLQEAYHIFIRTPENRNQYQVYAHLRRLGYSVIRHQGRSDTSQYEQSLKLDQYLKDGHNKKRKICKNNSDDKSFNPEKDNGTESPNTEGNLYSVTVPLLGKPLPEGNLYFDIQEYRETVLWDGEVTPLVAPEDATSTDAILKKLQIVKHAQLHVCSMAKRLCIYSYFVLNISLSFFFPSSFFLSSHFSFFHFFFLFFFLLSFVSFFLSFFCLLSFILFLLSSLFFFLSFASFFLFFFFFLFFLSLLSFLFLFPPFPSYISFLDSFFFLFSLLFLSSFYSPLFLPFSFCFFSSLFRPLPSFICFLYYFLFPFSHLFFLSLLFLLFLFITFFLYFLFFLSLPSLFSLSSFSQQCADTCLL
ncbi:TSEN54 [Acanthosepion pharaonis]|uniref:TSEN54 n=1 Tax=Acanthosepion pharaonis TaxID=158019 RepID=A0A812E4W2_ACAPH|nr:TSEN54 [Sepia pharaonis]